MKDQIEEAINSLIDSEKNPVVGDYIDELDGIMQEAFLGWGGPGPDDPEAAKEALEAILDVAVALQSADSDEIDKYFRTVPESILDQFNNFLQKNLVGWGGPGPEKNDMITFGEELELSVQGLLQGFEEKI